MSARKTIEEHKLNGNPSKLTLKSGQNANLIPIDPAEASEVASTAVEIVQGLLGTNTPWLASTDHLALRLLADMIDQRETVMGFIALADENAAMDIANQQRVELRKINDQIIVMLKELSLTPISRSKLGLTEVKAVSKMESIRAAAAEKRRDVAN